MAGVRQQIRRTDTYDYNDGLWYAEMIFHTIDNRIGVQGDIFTSWFPFVEDDTWRLDKGWSLTGKAGNVSYLQMVWDHPNTLLLRPFHPDFPYPENHAESKPIVTFTASSIEFTQGPDEFLNAGAPNSLENFEVNRKDQSYNIPLTSASTTKDIPQLSGNGFLWIGTKSQNFGLTIAEQGTVDNSGAIKNKGNQKQTWAAKGKNVVGFTIPANLSSYPNASRGIGYRSWVFFDGASDQKLTFSMVVNDYFTRGMVFSTRIGQPGNWQTFTTKMNGQGQQHLTFEYDPKLNTGDHSKPLALDWLYEWFYDSATYSGVNQNVRMELGCMTVHEGWISAANLNPAWHAFVEENGYSTRYGFSSRKEYANQPIGTVTFKTPMISDDYRLSLTSLKTMSVLEKSRYGFVYSAAGAVPNELWSFTYSAKVVGDLSDIA